MAKRDYDVGRGKPPRHTQFQKGQSGNPAGRPRSARNLRTELAQELLTQVLVRENGRPRKASKGQLIVKALVAKAVAGDAKAAALLLDLMLKLQGTEEPEEARGKTVLEPEDAAILAAYKARLGRGGGHD